MTFSEVVWPKSAISKFGERERVGGRDLEIDEEDLSNLEIDEEDLEEAVMKYIEDGDKELVEIVGRIKKIYKSLGGEVAESESNPPSSTDEKCLNM